MGLLDGLFGGNNADGTKGGGMSPMMMALLGLLAYKTMSGGGKSLSDIFGGATDSKSGAGLAPGSMAAGQAGGLGSLLTGGLGALLGGGSAGSLVSGGL